MTSNIGIIDNVVTTNLGINVGINVEKAEASGFALGPPSLSVGKDVISAGPEIVTLFTDFGKATVFSGSALPVGVTVTLLCTSQLVLWCTLT